MLARIRDIRSSEKVFWRKELDVYATSSGYDAITEQLIQINSATRSTFLREFYNHDNAEVVSWAKSTYSFLQEVIQRVHEWEKCSGWKLEVLL
ncbi:MAG: hypothetical protein A6F72_07185 [Cycloclasticus sp. symbiont of Poecilosclerida sp. N]|nr:MAG: hypothetical protein A6F72_07185 [Cycloclasticus sp. symbiont of Poecilosclerida sp. N]